MHEFEDFHNYNIEGGHEIPELHNNWGEPERAPHKRYSCARIVYILLLLLLLWYVGHAKYMPSMALWT